MRKKSLKLKPKCVTRYLLEVYLKPLGMHCATLIFLKRGFYDRAEGNESKQNQKEITRD